MPIAYCLLPIAYCLLPIAYCLLPVAWLSSGPLGQRTKIAARRGLLADNDRRAAANRRLFDRAGVLAVNLMSSPGAGKTTLLEKTALALRGRLRLGVVAGDIQTSLDADRLAALGVPARQINTGGACHLDARQVAGALQGLDLAALDLLFLENVGNLVCPAAFALGEHRRAVLVSLPEGEDKPLKYPRAFLEADVILVTKADLEGRVPCPAGRLEESCRRINPRAPLLRLSALTGAGMAGWLGWLKRERAGLGRGR